MEKGRMERALEAAIQAGGDFAEVFFEDTVKNSVEYKDGKIDSALCGRDYGVGIRVLSGENYAYAYTCDTSEESLIETARAAAQGLQRAGGSAKALTLAARREIQFATMAPRSVAQDRRAEIAMRMHDAAKGYSKEIVQVQSGLADVEQNVIIANTQGVYVEDTRYRSRMFVTAAASDGKEMQTGFEGPGAGRGFEFFLESDPERVALEAAKQAVTMLHAPFAPAGVMPVVIDGAFGGVIFHEACGHSLEATSVARGNSEFAGKMGEKIASDKVTAIDDGTLLGQWGSIGYDDEGNPSERNVLIENGILTGYMVDIVGGRRMGMRPTGSGRRQNYRYAPTSRMTNTFIAPGEDVDIIRQTDHGLYAKKMGGGSVNPLTGEFNFAVVEGYLIRNGEITSPVRGATLIGKGSEVLQKIDMVEKEMTLGEGMCGSSSGSVPTCVGQPQIRVSQLLVGGRDA